MEDSALAFWLLVVIWHCNTHFMGIVDNTGIAYEIAQISYS